MDASTPSLPEVAIVLSAAALALALMIWRGWIHRDALAAAPRREVGLRLWDAGGVVVCWLLGAVATQAIAMATGLLDDQFQPASVGGDPAMAMAKVALLSQAILLVLIAGYALLAARLDMGSIMALGVRPRRPWREAAAVVIGILVALALTQATNLGGMGLARLLGLPPPVIAHDLLEMMRNTRSSTALTGLALSAVVLAPIVEEFTFRGLLQTILANALGWRRRWAAVVLTSLLFAAIHFHAVWPLALPGLFVLSLVLGWLYERHGSLWPPILVHALFNAANVAYALWGLEPVAP